MTVFKENEIIAQMTETEVGGSNSFAFNKILLTFKTTQVHTKQTTDQDKRWLQLNTKYIYAQRVTVNSWLNKNW